jgi:hypothetical protein
MPDPVAPAAAPAPAPAVAAPPPPPAPAPAVPPNSVPKGADVDTATATSVAKGTGTDALGDQVHPATMTNEADGHRTLANPVTDPGPYQREGGVNIAHPDRSKGQHRIGDANEAIGIRMRTSTGHDKGFARGAENGVVTDEKMAPDLAIGGAASDCYHPSTGDEKSLTAAAQAQAAEPKEVAPLKE